MMETPAHDLLTIRTMLQAGIDASKHKLDFEQDTYGAYSYLRSVVRKAIELLEAEERA